MYEVGFGLVLDYFGSLWVHFGIILVYEGGFGSLLNHFGITLGVAGGRGGRGRCEL